MFRKIELYLQDLIKGRRGGPLALFLKGILCLLSWPYQIIVSIRNWAFDHGWFRRYTPPVPVVISIGNIVAGGTGKTPVTLALAQQFAQEFCVAILSRGYRSKAENLAEPIMLSRGDGPLHPPAFCGDEPYLLSQNLPKAVVIVGRDRHKASDMAAQMGAQLILLDDGMQHRHLDRDYEIVVMDGQDPFGKGHFLPRGFLREGLGSLSRADVIILNHVQDSDHYHTIVKQIACHSKAKVVGTKIHIAGVWNLQNADLVDLDGKEVALFCGIAHPEYFQDTVNSLGAHVIQQYVVPDHREFSPDAFKEFAEDALKNGAEWLICTEKDKVRLDTNSTVNYPIAWVQMRLTVVEGLEAWECFVQKAKDDLLRRI
jgi:tetraacyldisaccharide 4'-kinase